jgi:hypothetical protein
MSELEQAIRRIEFCADTMEGEADTVVRDIRLLIEAAKQFIEIKKQQQSASDVLLSDEFLTKFAEAFANTAFPSTITSLLSKGTVTKAPDWAPLLKTDVFEVKELT